MDYVELHSRDGGVWRLRYNHRALRWMEEEHGLSMMSVDLDNPAGVGFRGISILLAAGLYHEHREITLDEVDDMIDRLSYPALVQSIQQAIEAGLRVQDLLPEENGQSGEGNAGVGIGRS